MRRLLSLLLVLGLSAEFLPACTDAEASTDYISGAAARRSRGDSCAYETPTDHYWDFEPDDADDDYLGHANVDALEADSFTVVGRIRVEDLANDDGTVFSNITGAGDDNWALYFQDPNTCAALYAENNCEGFSTDATATATWVSGEDVLLAMTFDYSGNAGAGDSTLKIYIIEDGGTTVTTDATAVGPVLDCTAVLRIASIHAAEANMSLDGRMYWTAYYASVIAQGDLEDMFDEVSHPACDFTPVLYEDFHEAVAATNTTEVGAYEFDVFGSPVQGP